MRSYTVAPLHGPGPGRLRGGMFLISMFRCQRCSMSGLDFRALEQRPVRDYNFYKLELQWPLIGTMWPELRLLNLHFFNICRHHPTLKFKPHATDDKR